MNKYLIYLFLILISNCIYSKDIQNQLSIVDKLDLPFEFDENSILQHYFGNTLYVMPTDQDIASSSELYIFSYTLKDKKLDSMILDFPNEHKNTILYNARTNQIMEIPFFAPKSFAISDKYLVVAGSDKLLVYEYQNNTYVFKYVVFCKEIYGYDDNLCFDNFLIKDDILLGYRCTIADAGGFGGYSVFAKNAADTEMVSTAIMKYDLNTHNLLNFKIINPEPKGAGYLNFSPRNNMDCSGKYFIISDVIEYNLYLYDTDWKLIDMINPKHKEWIIDKDFPDIKTIATAYKSGTSISLLEPFTYKTSLTHNVFFQNDSTIIVSWSVPNGSNDRHNRYTFYFDKYAIRNNKLVLLDTYEEAKVDKNSSISFLLSGANAIKYPRNYFMNYNYMFTISGDIPFSIFSNEIKQMSLKDYYKKLDDYYISNDGKKSILIYRFNK